MSLLKQDTTKKGRVDKNNVTELDAGNNKGGKYKVKAIWDSAVYVKKSESSYLPGLYYLVFWKSYLEKQNTWELASVIQHLRKLISLFQKDYFNKSTAIFEAIDIALLIGKQTIRPTAPKQK